MKSLIIIISFFSLNQISFCQNNWVKRAGGANTDLSNGIWVDNKNNIFITGSISGKSKFFKTEVNSQGGGDVYIAKYSPDGGLLWIKTFGGKLDDFSNAITGDPDGNIYVTGIFTDTAYFGNQTLAAKGTDVFVLKLNNRGQVDWAKSLSTSGTALPQCIAVTDQGGVYIGGLFSVQYSQAIQRQMGMTDGFITKLTWQGEASWTKVVGGSGFDEVTMVSTDPWGRVLAGGVFEQIMYVDDFEISGNSSKSAFALRLEATGNVLWSKSFSGNDSQTQISDAVTDIDGNVYLTGKFSGETQFGNTVLISKGQTDVFLTAIASGGDLKWASSLGGADVEEALSIQMTSNSKSLLVSGLFNKYIEHGRTNIQAQYDNQLFISRWDIRGNLDELRAQNFNSVFHCSGKRIDPAGNVWLTGSFTEKSNFGKLNFVSAGEEDIFISAISDSKIAR